MCNVPLNKRHIHRRYVSFKEKETAVCGFIKPDKKLNERDLKFQQIRVVVVFD